MRRVLRLLLHPFIRVQLQHLQQFLIRVSEHTALGAVAKVQL